MIEDDDFVQLDIPLSDREIFYIGRAIALWGAIEHTVFTKTLNSFHDINDITDLPKSMNNLQFSGVLELWKSRVVDAASENPAKVLLRQYERIIELLPQRNALVHGMWGWDPGDLKKIKIVRFKKNEIITSYFDEEALERFQNQLGAILFNITYPDGLDEYEENTMRSGSTIGRRAIAFLKKDSVAGNFHDTDKSLNSELPT